MCDLYRDEEAERGARVGMSELVDELVVAATNIRIYWSDHPRVAASVESLTVGLQGLFSGRADDKLILGVSDDCLFFDQKPLLGATISAPRIVRRLQELQTGGISFDRRAAAEDFTGLVTLLGRQDEGTKSHEQANMQLELYGCRFIRFLPAYRADGTIDGPVGEGAPMREPIVMSEDLVSPVKLYRGTVELLQEAVVAANHGRSLNVDGAKGMVESILHRLADDAPTMRSMTRYERYDAYTFGHSIRVCTLALSFARSLLDEEDLILRVGMAGLLHDIGKAWVPFEVLHSTGRLNPEERLEMNKHAEHGARILLSLPEADPLVVATAFSHHRTHDGGGYPEVPFRAPQSVGSRIVKICDVYEALTAVRPYKKQMTPIRAYRVMLAMKNHFDPGLLRRFVEVNGLFPIGSEVLTGDGAHARVMRQGGRLDRPVVQMLDSEGNVSSDEPIDLGVSGDLVFYPDEAA